jgi:hypothetical protein
MLVRLKRVNEIKSVIKTDNRVFNKSVCRVIKNGRGSLAVRCFLNGFEIYNKSPKLMIQLMIMKNAECVFIFILNWREFGELL